MKRDKDKTKEQPVSELAGLRQRVAELEAPETKRKQAEKTLHESEERYSAILNLGAKIGEAIIMRQDTDQGEGIMSFVNDEWCRITGYSKEELLGISFFDLVHPKDREASRGRYRKRMRGESLSGLFELCIIRKDGVEVPIELTSAHTTYRGEQANVAYIRDITERKQAEDKIQQQNEFLNTVLESLTHPFYVIDANDYTVKLANSVASVGRSSENITCYALTHKSSEPCGSAEHPCPLEEVKKTRKPVVIEHIHYDKDGNFRNVEVHGFPVFDTEGNIIQMIEYCLDITERKQAEEALRESEGKYRALVENATDFIYMIDKDNRILSLNESAANLFGKAFRELIGKTVFDLFPKEIAAQFSKNLKWVFETGSTKTVESKMIAGEREMWISTSLSPVKGYKDKVITVMGVTRNITKRKQAETEREELIKDLEASLERIQTLSGLIPICAWCKKIRDDKGYWESVEAYIGERTKAEFTHGMCPECAEKYGAAKGS